MDDSLQKLILSAITIAIGFGVYFLIKKRLTTKLNVVKKKKNKGSKKRATALNLILNVTKIFIILLVLLSVLQIIGLDIKTIIASLSVVGVVLGLAVQDILKDFISGISIVFDELYVVGDIVEIQGFKGEVTRIGLRTTRIKSWSGEVKIISNRTITDLINYTVSNSMAVVDVTIDYEEDIEKFEKDLKATCKELSETIENVRGDIEVWGMEDLGNSYITYRIAAETVPEAHYGVRREIRKALYNMYQEKNYKIPYQKMELENGK